MDTNRGDDGHNREKTNNPGNSAVPLRHVTTPCEMAVEKNRTANPDTLPITNAITFHSVGRAASTGSPSSPPGNLGRLLPSRQSSKTCESNAAQRAIAANSPTVPKASAGEKAMDSP